MPRSWQGTVQAVTPSSHHTGQHSAGSLPNFDTGNSPRRWVQVSLLCEAVRPSGLPKASQLSSEKGHSKLRLAPRLQGCGNNRR